MQGPAQRGPGTSIEEAEILSRAHSLGKDFKQGNKRSGKTDIQINLCFAV